MKLATVGAGYFSQFHYEAWSRIREVDLAGICNKSVDKARQVASEYGRPPVYSDFNAMLAETRPDIVDVITPPETHFAYVDAALDAGCHVICQKPFTETLEQARALAGKADARGLTLAVHENFRFQPWYREIARQLAAGTIGQLYQATFRLRPGDGQGTRAYLDRQPYFQQMPRFLVHETGVHWVDTFRFLFGAPDWVNADLRKLNPAIAGEDAGIVVFGHDNGFRAVLDGNRLSDHAAHNRRLTMGEMTIEGALGTLALSGDGTLTLRRFGSNTVDPVPYFWNDNAFGGDCVYLLQRHVIDHITKGTPLENRASAYLDVIACENAIYKSNEDGRKIPLK